MCPVLQLIRCTPPHFDIQREVFLGENVAVNLYLKSSIWGTFYDVNCLYSETLVMLKLRKKARGHFVSLMEMCMHLIRGNSRHILVHRLQFFGF